MNTMERMKTMGLFRDKGTCTICGSNKGLEIKDGYVCKECLHRCGKFLTNTGLIPRKRSVHDLLLCIKQNEQFIATQEQRRRIFEINERVYGIDIDQTHCLFSPMPKDAIFSFDELQGFRLRMNDDVIAQNTSSYTDSMEAYYEQANNVYHRNNKGNDVSRFCVELHFDLFVQPYYSDYVSFSLSSSMIQITEEEFYERMKQAKKILQFLYDIRSQKDQNTTKVDANQIGHDKLVDEQQVIPYEELKKIKELLDLNILTQEEFDALKKQLLKR